MSVYGCVKAQNGKWLNEHNITYFLIRFILYWLSFLMTLLPNFFSELHIACMHYVIFPVCSYALTSRCNIRPYRTQGAHRNKKWMWKSPRRGECAITYTTFWVIQCGINDNLTIFVLLLSIFRSIFSIRPLQKDLEVCYDMRWHCEICFSFVRSVYVLQTKLFLF